MPRVSVVIPTYNREHLIKRAIESVFNQTYRDLEIIVCDDCSTDKTLEVVKSMIDEAPIPLRLEVLPKNLGVAAARNWAVYQSQSELIAFLDSDDLWMPEKIEKQIAYLDSRPEYIGVGCGITDIRKDGITVVDKYRKSPELNQSNEIFNLLYQCYITTSCFLVKKEALVLAGLFDLRLRKSQDRDLWWRLPRLGRLGYIDEPLITYLVHDESISHKQSIETGKTYIPAIKRSVWYWHDVLNREEINKILAHAYLLIAYDSTNSGDQRTCIIHCLISLYYGGSLRKKTMTLLASSILRSLSFRNHFKSH